MKTRYLEVTFRKGKPLAAYLYLPRGVGERSVRTEARGQGTRVDYAADGRAIGIEITAPSQLMLEDINRILLDLGLPSAGPEELAPLKAA